MPYADNIANGETIELRFTIIPKGNYTNTLYTQYGKDSVLLAALAYNCGPGVVNKSTVLAKLKRGDRNIYAAYTSHCLYKGKWHKGLYQRRCTEILALFIP